MDKALSLEAILGLLYCQSNWNLWAEWPRKGDYADKEFSKSAQGTSWVIS